MTSHRSGTPESVTVPARQQTVTVPACRQTITVPAHEKTLPGQEKVLSP
ncbi:hypothetical protein [Streptomyces sp. NPDC088725]